MNKTKTVVVGMSGGVDSSVAAFLLKEQGYHVIGMFMKNWEEKDSQGVCQASKEFEDVVKVCEKLQIPYYSVNFAKEYWDNVFTSFLNELKLGHTPNPDVLCNREIKFKALLEKALSLGADYLATGHYCRTKEIDGKYHLLRGLDSDKDQSYFLYTLQEAILQKTLFPIGDLTKSEVRRIAKQEGLSTFDKKDSTGICFIGERNFKQFISGYIPYQPGNFETLQGKIIGKHDGIAYYTIGQRKGLNIGGPGDAWFVVGKDTKRNVVFVEQGKDHPSLYASNLTATECSWVNHKPITLPFSCSAKIRYRQQDSACTLTSLDAEKFLVSFQNPQRAITPRQSVVFYDKEVCLGGAIISAS
jgi:tRNA-specific 2-thiouridylase